MYPMYLITEEISDDFNMLTRKSVLYILLSLIPVLLNPRCTELRASHTANEQRAADICTLSFVSDGMTKICKITWISPSPHNPDTCRNWKNSKNLCKSSLKKIKISMEMQQTKKSCQLVHECQRWKRSQRQCGLR